MGPGIADNPPTEKLVDLGGRDHRTVAIAGDDTIVHSLAARDFLYNVADTGIRGVSWDPKELPEGVAVRILLRRASDETWAKEPKGELDGKVCTYRPGITPHRIEFDRVAVVVANGRWNPTQETWDPARDFDASTVNLTFHRGCDWPDRLVGSITTLYDYVSTAYVEHQTVTATLNERYIEPGDDTSGDLPFRCRPIRPGPQHIDSYVACRRRVPEAAGMVFLLGRQDARPSDVSPVRLHSAMERRHHALPLRRLLQRGRRHPMQRIPR